MPDNRPIRLNGRSLHDFEPLRPAEKTLRDACRNGIIAEISGELPETATVHNTVRAEFLRFLALGGDTQAPIHEHGVQAFGARIEGLFDCQGAQFPNGMELIKCKFSSKLNLKNTIINGNLALHGCHVPGILGDLLTCKGHVNLDFDFVTTGSIELQGAKIEGNLQCTDGTFSNETGPALFADSMVVKGSVFLNNNFTAHGEVRLLGAQIDGNFECIDGNFNNKNGFAVSADTIIVKGNAFLCGNFTVNGGAKFVDARIGGNLQCTDGTFSNETGPALFADRAVVNGSVFLNEKFTSKGEVRLLGAQIGDNLQCNGGNFNGDNSPALSTDTMLVKGSVFLDKNFTAEGEVRLLGAQIGRNLECGGGTFDGGASPALSADNMVVKGSVFLRKNFTAKGEVRLLGAQIGGSLECGGGNFSGGTYPALSADRMVVKGSVALNNNFIAKGEIRILAAQIGSNLDCRKGNFNNERGPTLVGDNMLVNGSFIFDDLAHPVNHICIDSAHVSNLVDDKQSWGEHLIINGFTYDSFSGKAPTDATTRLAWLKKQRPEDRGTSANNRDFKPQPWQQLIRTLRLMGHELDATDVAIAREKHLRQIGRIGYTQKTLRNPLSWLYSPLARGLHWSFGLLTDYGYRPVKLLKWMILVWLLTSSYYWLAALNGIFGPSNPLVFNHEKYAACRPLPDGTESKKGKRNWYLCPDLDGEYTTFSPLSYSMDLLLPLVDLQQDRDWAPIIPTPKAIWHKELLHFSSHHITRLVIWLEILFGWIASLLMVAVLTGLTNRDKE